MKVSPNYLASFIEAAMKKYEIIKLDDVPTWCHRKHNKPFMVFTME